MTTPPPNLANTDLAAASTPAATRKRFCTAPFTKFETLIDGNVAPCCSLWMSERMGSIDNASFAEIWNSDAAQRIRASIHDNSFRYCRADRCRFLIHGDLPYADEIDDPYLKEVIADQRTELERPPTWLFLAHDLTCNLSCPSCRDRVLAVDETGQVRLDVIERTVLRPILAADQRVLISLSGQGDPWSSPHYRSFLKYLANGDFNIDLNLHTNGILLTESRWREYQGLEKYHPLISVSIDAVNDWTYRVVRRGGRWAPLERNLVHIGERRRAGAFRCFETNATVQLDNFHELRAMVQYAQRAGCDEIMFYMIQNTGDHLRSAFDHLNVADPTHPLHLAFLETLRDPILSEPIVRLYDVDLLRKTSLESRLPSDDATGLDAPALAEHIIALAASGRQSEAIALCAHARFAHLDVPDFLVLEAQLLQQAGFARQATYRWHEHLAATGDPASSRVGLGTASIDAGEIKDGIGHLLAACTADSSLLEPATDYLAALLTMREPAPATGRKSIPIVAAN